MAMVLIRKSGRPYAIQGIRHQRAEGKTGPFARKGREAPDTAQMQQGPRPLRVGGLGDRRLGTSPARTRVPIRCGRHGALLKEV